jgi:hypothetical protein
MVSANIDIFEMEYKSANSYFIRLENLEKIRSSNAPAPTVAVDKNTSLTSSVGVGPATKTQINKMWCHYCDKNNHNVEKLRRSNDTIRPNMGSRLLQEKCLILSFSRKLMPSKSN